MGIWYLYNIYRELKVKKNCNIILFKAIIIKRGKILNNFSEIWVWLINPFRTVQIFKFTKKGCFS